MASSATLFAGNGIIFPIEACGKTISGHRGWAGFNFINKRKFSYKKSLDPCEGVSMRKFPQN